MAKVNRLSKALFDVNQATNDKQLAKLKLYATLVGAPVAKIENAECDSVENVYYILTEHFSEKKDEAKQLLLAMLSKIGVRVDTLETLGSKEEAVKAWENDVDYAFGKLIITLCNMLSDKQFDSLKGLLRDHLNGLHPDKVKTREDMFSIVIRRFKDRKDFLQLLVVNFEHMHLQDCVDLVHEFEEKMKTIDEVSENGHSNGRRHSEQETSPPPTTTSESVEDDSTHADSVAGKSYQESKVINPNKEAVSVGIKPSRPPAPEGSLVVGTGHVNDENESPEKDGTRVHALRLQGSSPPKEGPTVIPFNESGNTSASPPAHLHKQATPLQETNRDQRNEQSTLTPFSPDSPATQTVSFLQSVDSDSPNTTSDFSSDDIMMEVFGTVSSIDTDGHTTSPFGDDGRTTPSIEDNGQTTPSIEDNGPTPPPINGNNSGDALPVDSIEHSSPTRTGDDKLLPVENRNSSNSSPPNRGRGSIDRRSDSPNPDRRAVPATNGTQIQHNGLTIVDLSATNPPDTETPQPSSFLHEDTLVQLKNKVKSIPHSWQCLLPTTCCVIFPLIICVITLIAFLTLLHCHPHPIKYPPTESLGVDGDSVIVGYIDGKCVSSVTLTEVLHRNDYSHVNRIYIAPNSSLKIHHNTTKYTSRNYTQTVPSRATGLVDYIYLLSGSIIKYRICLGSLSSETGYGHMYVFDNLTNYVNFITHVRDAESAAVHTIPLTIVADDEAHCMDLTYTVTKDAYYFITGEAPGNIYYHYNYTFEVNYLNRFDYEHMCDVYIPRKCVIDTIPKEEVLVIAYVVPPVAADPFTTHIAMEFGDSSCVYDPCHRGFAYLCLVVGLLSLVFPVGTGVVCYLRHNKQYSCRRRCGYERLREDQR